MKIPTVDEYLQPVDKKHPNILWIMLDHVTFRHYKLTQGARPVLPVYERLAKEGMEFTNCHSVHPLCLPARASMLTGMYANNHGKLDNESYPDAGYPFYTDYLKCLGYRVGHFGKNHSGYENFAEKGIEGFYPASYGNPYRTPEYCGYLDRKGYGHPIYCQEWAMPTGKHMFDNGEYDLTESGNFNMYSAGCLKNTGRVHESDFLTCEALDWIENVTCTGEPWAARVDMWGPHHAYQVPWECKDLIEAADIQEYPTFSEPPVQKAEMVRYFQKRIQDKNSLRTWEEWQPLMKRAYEQYSYIDRAVGRMLDELEKKGILDRTIVIYTADHGDALGSHGGLVDKAGDVMEEVMHIPMVVRWPGVTDGTSCDALVSNLDLVPTVLEMAGCRAPSYMDGASMAPLLRGKCSTRREDLMAQHYGHFGIRAPQRVLYYRNYKYIANEGDVHELYDLEQDPFERVNLIAEPECREIAGQLKQRLAENMREHGDDGELVKDILRKLDGGSSE